MPVLVEYTDICGRLGQEEDGLAGRESRERSASTELGTAEEARAQALEVSISCFFFPYLLFLFHVFLGFLLFYFYFLAAGQDRRKRGGYRGSGDGVERNQGQI